MFTKIKQLIVDDGIGGLIVIVLVSGTIGYWIGVWNTKSCDKCSESNIRMSASEARQASERANAYMSGWNDCRERFHIDKSEQERIDSAFDDGYVSCLLKIGDREDYEKHNR